MKSMVLIVYMLLITGINIYLWLNLVDGHGVYRSGRMLGLIIMLVSAAVFADKLSNNQFAPAFIRAGCVIGMTVLCYILFQL